MPAVLVIDEERHLTEALLGEIGRPLVLALAHVHVLIIERLAEEGQHEADLVGGSRAGGTV
jgi:hypothetical protein